MQTRIGALLVAAALASSCSKSETKVTWDDVDRPAVVDQNKAAATGLTAPPMFAHIPADTPYVFAAFTPIPGAYWKRACEEMCPALEKMIAAGADAAGRSSGADARLAAAVLGELRGNLSADGFRKLGLTTEPRFALYGLGPLPVFRMEIADPAALAATVARIESKSGSAMPTRSAGAQKYWFAGDGEFALAAGIVGKELVVTGGGAKAVERAVPILFGGEKLPGPNMASGDVLKKLAADYGFAGYGLGYVDLRRVGALAFGDEKSIHGDMWRLWRDDAADDKVAAAAEAPADEPRVPDPVPMRPPDPPPEPPVAVDAGVALAVVDAGAPPPVPPVDPAVCRAAVDKITARFPRVVFGYDEISDKRASFSATFETDAATAAQLKKLETRSPGVTTRVPDAPLMAFGGAIDVKAAKAFIADLEGAWKATNAACALVRGDDDDDDDDDGGGLGIDLPGNLSADSVRGALFVLQGGDLGGGMPSNLEGYAIIGVSDPSALSSAGELLAMAGVRDFQPDGKFRTIDLGGMGMFSSLIKRPLKVAGRDDALVIAAGDRARATAEKAMAQTGGRSPLFMIAYDVGRVAKATSGMFDGLGGSSGYGDPDDDALDKFTRAFSKDLLEAEARLFGLVVFSGHATDRGLGLVGRMDLR